MLNYYRENPATIARALRALAHPTRLAIVRLLHSGAYCNCELSAALGCAENLVSHHVRSLEGAGLLRSERDPNDARWVYYSLDKEAVAALSAVLGEVLDVATIGERQPSCGPRAAADSGPCANESSVRSSRSR